MKRVLLSLVPLLLAACNASNEDVEDDPVSGSKEEVAVQEVEEPTEEAPRREFPSELVEGEPMYTVLEIDGISAIDDPVFVAAAQAEDFMQAEETVLGVVGADGTAKCYSAWQLDAHEIVNDVLDGVPIAATW